MIQAPFYPTMTPSIGTAYLSSVLKQNGNDVKLFDIASEFIIQRKILGNSKNELRNNKEKRLKLMDNFLNGYIDRIDKEKPDVVGFSVYSDSLHYSQVLAKKIKNMNKNIKIVFGGPGVLDRILYKNLFLDPNIDFIIQGEGEITFPDLINRLNNNKKVEKTIIGGEIKDLDKLPFPDYDPKDIEIKKFPYFLPIVGSRSCVYKCRFCSIRLTMPNYRQRSCKNIVEEMAYLKDKHGINTFWFFDCLLNAKKNRLEQLSDEILKKGLQVYWGGYLVANGDINFNLCKNLYKAGCRFFRIGVESGSQKVLNHMNKAISIEAVGQIIKNIYEANIFVRLSFIVGYPTETSEDFLETFDFLIKNNHSINTFVHFKFSMDRGMFEPNNPLLKLKEKSDRCKELRHKILELFLNCKTGEDSTLFLLTKNYKNYKNPVNNKRIFKRPLIINDDYCSDKIIKLENYVTSDTPIEKCVSLIKNYNQLFVSLVFEDDRYLHLNKILKLIPDSKEVIFTRPLPKCLQVKGNSPKSCNECLEFIKVKNDCLYACKNFLKIETKNDSINQKCKTCEFFIKNQCFPCHYLLHDACFEKV